MVFYKTIREQALLKDNQIHQPNETEFVPDAGLVTPFTAERLLGDLGSVLILTLIAMTLMSTCSGEVMAVFSIIVYDIYQIYVYPFR
ncbi:hypothetical protein DPMN_115513 [Dreissena polymorpha]|uniref:Uncharacterized protein n=1 Tax=Dreissena polymorpha TaxID=45954 RepID=A0A9D4QTU2_DREPO|nr:hypothetical protein DPMN_115513 [Dreissena polymorpha]